MVLAVVQGKAAWCCLLHVQVLVARDRAGATMDYVQKAMDMATLSVALKPFLTKDVVLCTDGSKAFAGAARKIGMSITLSTRQPVSASTVLGTCRMSTLITVSSKPGYKSFAVWPRATWTTISAGFVP